MTIPFGWAMYFPGGHRPHLPLLCYAQPLCLPCITSLRPENGKRSLLLPIVELATSVQTYSTWMEMVSFMRASIDLPLVYIPLCVFYFPLYPQHLTHIRCLIYFCNRWMEREHLGRREKEVDKKILGPSLEKGTCGTLQSHQTPLPC